MSFITKNNQSLILLTIFVVIFASALVVLFTKTNKSEEINFVKATPMPIAEIGEIPIKVEIVDTEEKRHIGLSGKLSLPYDQGMLFLFDSENITVPFWMKDMKFPIDIIWINDGKIIQIDKNSEPILDSAPPSSYRYYLPREPIDMVLEVNAGFSDTNQIKIGDTFKLIK